MNKAIPIYTFEMLSRLNGLHFFKNFFLMNIMTDDIFQIKRSYESNLLGRESIFGMVYRVCD